MRGKALRGFVVSAPALPFNVRLVLASQSPRRRLLLQQAGLEHEAVHPGIDDALLEPGEGVSAARWAAALAFMKARAGWEASRHSAGVVVIGADTVVVKDGRFIGQPRDAAEARRIIETLQDGRHEVVTGVALVWCGQSGEGEQCMPERRLFADRAIVRVGHIGDERIGAYIASGQWRGKAGAYNLSERLEAGWPIDYEGDAGTIMGLPVMKLVAELARLRQNEGGRG